MWRQIWIGLALVCTALSSAAIACDDSVLSNRDWEVYYDSKYEACKTSFDALDRAKETFSRFTPGKIKALGEYYKAYDRDCMERFEDLRCETRQLLSARLGALFHTASNPDVPICTAFRIDQSHVLTARHCLYDSGRRLAMDSLTLRFLSEPDRTYSLMGERFADEVFGSSQKRGRSNYSDVQDIAVLEIPSDAAPPVPMVALADLPRGKRLLIPAVFVPALHIQQTLDAASWIEAIRFDLGYDCSYFERLTPKVDAPPNSGRPVDELLDSAGRAQCVINRCQTFKGMSGAPLLGFQPDVGLFVDGVFLGAGSEKSSGRGRSGSCRSASFDDYNIGVRLPDRLRAALQAGHAP